MTSINKTVLQSLITSLETASTYNRSDQVAPRTIIWTDGDSEWKSVIHLIADSLSNLLILDEDAPSETAGASTYLRYMIGKAPQGGRIFVYLPGVSRQSFRSAVGFPKRAKHLYALQYQSSFWTQKNGKDWTPTAFLASSDGGLGLDVATDAATRQAVHAQLRHVLQSFSDDLKGHRLEASDFHDLVLSDPIRTMLQWIATNGESKNSMDPEEWAAFSNVAKTGFGIDPESDGVLTALERLVRGGGMWDESWHRYEEAYPAFPGVRAMLDRIEPQDMSDNNPRIARNNSRSEEKLRKALSSLDGLVRSDAIASLSELCNEHIARSEGLWASLGEAPLAEACAHLRLMLDSMQIGISGNSWESIAESYIENGWKTDSSVWKALACATSSPDSTAVTTAIRSAYPGWLEGLTDRTSSIMSGYPVKGPEDARELPKEKGTVIVFVDGLRADLSMELRINFERAGLEVDHQVAWAALPTVTATSKPAWKPFTPFLTGDSIESSMEPRKKEGGGPLRSGDFRQLLTDADWTWLDSTEVGNIKGRAWTQVGTIDHHGHDSQEKLATRLAIELQEIESRIKELLKAGWKQVVVVTDHGFQYLPGGLPAVSLPTHLTDSKWSRCALPNPAAQHSFSQVPWFWGNKHSIVVAPGISVFRNGVQYTHGGVSLQECLTPIITVTTGQQINLGQIAGLRWVGMRCRTETSGATEGFSVDIRPTPMDVSGSMCGGPKPVGDDGKVSLAIVDDGNEGLRAYVVLLNSDGILVSQQETMVGQV